jgi:hypothetical protein
MPDTRLNPAELEELGSVAYQAFCDAARAFLPAYLPDWSLLPTVVRDAWKSSAAAAMRRAAQFKR